MTDRWDRCARSLLLSVALVSGLRGCCPEREIYANADDGDYEITADGPSAFEGLRMTISGDDVVLTYPTPDGIVVLEYAVVDRRHELAED